MSSLSSVSRFWTNVRHQTSKVKIQLENSSWVRTGKRIQSVSISWFSDLPIFMKNEPKKSLCSWLKISATKLTSGISVRGLDSRLKNTYLYMLLIFWLLCLWLTKATTKLSKGNTQGSQSDVQTADYLGHVLKHCCG